MTLWQEAKRSIRIGLRAFRDWRSGDWKRFARAKTVPDRLTDWHCLSLQQHIRPSASLENKLTNLRLACAAMHGLLLQPGAVFSFWTVVGQPIERRGFRRARNIVQGRLSLEMGGGLCQVSGIIYQLALTAGLEIRERHAHSLDLYTEDERVAPLGADATVVYGYKDLRLANNYPFPLVLHLKVVHNDLTFSIFSPTWIPSRQISFRRERVGEREKIETVEIEESRLKVLNVSWYGHL